MNRNISIDALKAFAIFLVVIGHVVQSTILHFDENYLFKLIYSFHMPLFVFLSGYLTYHKEGLKSNFIKRRFISLLLPYFSWMILYSILYNFTSNKSVITSLINVFFYPDNGLWFLWIIFWMHLLFFCCTLFSRKYLLVNTSLLSFFILIVIFALKLDNIFCNRTFAFLLPFYILGYLSNSMSAKLNSIYNKWFYLLPFFGVLVYYWQRNGDLSFHSQLTSSKLFIFVYKTIVASIGIVISMGFFNKVSQYNRIILFIGKNSLAIYAMNFLFLILFEPVISRIQSSSLYYFFVVILSVIIIFLCLLIANLINRNRFTALFLLGNHK